MKAVALSGATGFLGCHLLSHLLSRGYEVVALVRGTQHMAVRRVLRAVEFAGTADATARLASGQLTIVPADLEQAGLGIDPPDFRRLAGGLDEVWHCAAATDLDAPLESVSRPNVQGTGRMLELASAGGPGTRFVHISTAFVAGDRREGVVGAAELDSTHGFVTAYEASKYQAEVLVRSWAADGRRALVLRPSVLLTDRPLPARGPRGPFAALRWMLGRLAFRGPEYVVEHFGAVTDARGHIRLRLPGRRDALINVTRVEYAAEAVMRLALEDAGPGTVTRHVVHPVDTPVQMWIDALTAQTPWVHADLVEEWSAPTDLERLLVSMHPGGDRFGHQRRRYERAALDRAEARDGKAAPPALDAAYLTAALGSAAHLSRPAGIGA